MCPGNNESAGKHHGGRARKGAPWLRAVLGEVAASAGRSRTSHLGERYRRLAARRGKKRALVAVGHTVLIAAWQMLTSGRDYADLGPDHYLRCTKNPARRADRLVDELRALGYEAILAPAGNLISDSGRHAPLHQGPCLDRMGRLVTRVV